MEVEVAETDIRDLVFDYLGDFQELSDVKTKDVRVYIQQQLDLPDDYFQGHRKEMLINIITDFRNAPAKQTNASASKKSWQSPSENIEDVEFKEGKFSVTESDLIRKTVARYAEEQGIPIDDLDTSARNKEGRKQAKHLALWSELQDLLPDRKREAIWHHTQRILARPRTGHGRFTAVDIQRLKELVKVHGRNFIVIGGLMDKLPDDCQQVFLRTQHERKVTGFFSAEEDARLVDAVRAALKLPDALLTELPTKRLPWTSIAALLHNERLPLDYNRRFTVLLNKSGGSNSIRTGGASASVGNSNAAGLPAMDAALKRVESGRLARAELSVNARRLQLLCKLQEGGYLDESEVNWSALDREFNFHAASSSSRWKVLLKSCPANSADVATFEEKLEYLLDLFSKQASPPQSPQRRPAQSGAEPEPVKQSHRSVSNGGTMGSGPSIPASAIIDKPLTTGKKVDKFAVTDSGPKKKVPARRGVVHVSDSDSDSENEEDRDGADSTSSKSTSDSARSAFSFTSESDASKSDPSSSEEQEATAHTKSTVKPLNGTRGTSSHAIPSSPAGASTSVGKHKPVAVATNTSKAGTQNKSQGQSQWGTNWRDFITENDPDAVPPLAQPSQQTLMSQPSPLRSQPVEVPALSQLQTQLRAQQVHAAQSKTLQSKSQSSARQEIEVSSTSDQSSADVISVSSGKSSQQSQTSRRSQHAQDPEAEFDLMFSPTPKASAGGGTRSGGDGRPNSVVAGGEVKVKSDMQRNGPSGKLNQGKLKHSQPADCKEVQVKVDSDLSDSDHGDADGNGGAGGGSGDESGSDDSVGGFYATSKLDKKRKDDGKVKAEKSSPLRGCHHSAPTGNTGMKDKGAVAATTKASNSKAGTGAAVIKSANAPISMDKIYEVEDGPHAVPPSATSTLAPPLSAAEVPSVPTGRPSAATSAARTTTSVVPAAKATRYVSNAAENRIPNSQLTAHSEGESDSEPAAPITTAGTGSAKKAAKKKKNKKNKKRKSVLDSDSDDSGGEGGHQQAVVSKSNSAARQSLTAATVTVSNNSDHLAGDAGAPSSHKKKKKKHKKAKHTLEESTTAAISFYGSVSEVHHSAVRNTTVSSNAVGAVEVESKEDRKKRRKMEKALLANENKLL